ncbi:MAG TPA: hypothetical protein DEP24_08960, partial [Mycobacterium sp.]|nr:hypothetical protein [Mycobacterium sp.]
MANGENRGNSPSGEPVIGDAVVVTSGRPAEGPISIYVASPEGETGKSTIALGIVHRLAAMVPRVGVFRPI